ncbi:MAG TPA: BamA/TamA family outer membrane protein [Candidatus Cloacimonadota bacterium]|nr:BamA/TamA family outer membrane protein [Candidatus Cloacimonadota bacterium]HPS38604.1 BamA/TamA family outer membrane protein [Candidatus Cloacimonadota bacterium]
MKHNRLFLLALLLLICGSAFAYSFGQNKVNYRQTDWAYIETMHFDIYYPADQPEFGKLVALMAEERYYYIKDNLKYPVTSRIPVIFYPTQSEFQTTNIIYPLLSEGVGGFTESLKNRVVIPFDGDYRNLEELMTHELTHAYTNGLDNRMTNGLSSLRPTGFPFWFSEGLPEYLSIGGEDAYNNMFILDMVLNDNMGDLDYVDGYLAYRLGESFLTYISKIYGRSKVGEFFYAVRSVSEIDAASKKVFGIEFKDLQSRWRFQLKRDYYDTISTHSIPSEQYEKRTMSEKDGSYFNINPRFSPDGSRYVYFSDQGARFSVWIAGTHGLNPPKKVVQGEATASYEEFHYFRSSLSWFPDGKRICFASKTAEGDVVYIYDVDAEKQVSAIKLPGLSTVYELDVSPDGSKIVVAGQIEMQSDLFLYDLESGFLTRLTNDMFDDKQPRFSPDGKKIAYASQREATPAQSGFFDGLSTVIMVMDADGGNVRQYSSEATACSKPVWDGSGTKLIYLAEREGISNLVALDLEASARAPLSNTLSGVYSADISASGEYLILSIYFNNAWNIYFDNDPLKDLSYEPCTEPQPAEPDNSFFTSLPIARLDYFGKRAHVKIPRSKIPRQHDPRRPFFGELQYSPEDSLQSVIDYHWDAKPDSIGIKPVSRKYNPKFHLDSFWGGMAYSSGVGAIGYVQLEMSDLMGNHGIGIDLGISGKIQDSNLLLTYLYLKQRMDYGIGIYNIFDEAYYREQSPNPEDDYFRVRQRQTGLYTLLRYPLNRFLRVEFDQRIYQGEYHIDSWDWNAAYTEGSWVNDNYPLGSHYSPISGWVYTPGFSIIHDNALYGSTGPLVGWRGMYTVRKSFASHGMDYFTNYFDLRSYNLFAKRYAFANRLIGGISTGGSPQRFDLGGYYGIRAYDGDLSGEKKLVLSSELRFPFFDYLKMAFPVPLAFSNIRGAVFAEAGSAWDKERDFHGMHDGKLQDIHLGYGFGPRLNLGYVVLKIDVAWLTNFSKSSKPSYYLSLTEDF